MSDTLTAQHPFLDPKFIHTPSSLFLKLNVILDPMERIYFADLYAAYLAWAKDRKSSYIAPPNAFARDFKAAAPTAFSIHRGSKNRRFYQGVRLSCQNKTT